MKYTYDYNGDDEDDDDDADDDDGECNNKLWSSALPQQILLIPKVFSQRNSLKKPCVIQLTAVQIVMMTVTEWQIWTEQKSET